MVKIAIAGGTGQVAREIIDTLLATQKHELVILSRKAALDLPGVTFRTVNYDEKDSLIEALQDIHTVLSFIQLLSDPGSKAQKTLIDASIESGVKRFAPSEWGSAEIKDIPWWVGKGEVREYLEKVNENGKVLEYCLFQPGLFLDYLASPHMTSKHLTPLNTMFDFENRRAILVDGHDFVMTFTTAQDLTRVVAKALDFDGEWPEIGGIRGNQVTISELLKIGERVRGSPFATETVKLEDLEAGNLKTTWGLQTRHSAVAADEGSDFLKTVLIGFLVSGSKGAWATSDEINRILPDYEFTKMEDFLTKVWKGKP